MNTTTISSIQHETAFAQVTEPRLCKRSPGQPDVAPRSGHCQHDGCSATARPVYLEAGGAPVAWYCDAHRSSAGFCNGCGVFVADQPEHQVTWPFYGRCQACTEELLD